MHKFANLDPTDMNYIKRGWPGASQAYKDSKLANILMTRELSYKLRGTGESYAHLQLACLEPLFNQGQIFRCHLQCSSPGCCSHRDL